MSTSINSTGIAAYQLQPIIPTVLQEDGLLADSGTSLIRCAQALGSEIYIGHANGELLRYALQADDPNQPEAYTLLSRQTLPTNRPVDEIVILPSISRVLLLSDRQIHFYTLPSLDPINSMKPIRGTVAFTVDDQHLQRPYAGISNNTRPEGIDFCVIKRTGVQMYTLGDRLAFQRDVPLTGVLAAKRAGRCLCIAEKTENGPEYSIVDLETLTKLPIIAVCQPEDPPDFDLKPHILVTGEKEFLIFSWTGFGTIGIFMSGDGDPSRAPIEWPAHPTAVSFDYPHITTLLPDGSIEIRDIEKDGTVVQVIPAPGLASSPTEEGTPLSRTSLAGCIGGYSVPSARSDRLSKTSVPLLRTAAA